MPVCRHMEVTMQAGGALMVTCNRITGFVNRDHIGWRWWVYAGREKSYVGEPDFRGSQPTQWETYGELLSKMFELTT